MQVEKKVEEVERQTAMSVSELELQLQASLSQYLQWGILVADTWCKGKEEKCNRQQNNVHLQSSILHQ